MSDPTGSPDVNVKEESSKLSEALRNCRTVLESYRVMLAPRIDVEPAEPSALNDNSE